MNDAQTLNERKTTVMHASASLLSAKGLRGATMRDIAGVANVTTSALVSLFGDKNGLASACFAAAVERDLAHINAFVDECISMQVPATLAGPYLATLCEQAGGPLRQDMLTLLELLLVAPTDDRFRQTCLDWLSGRRDAFRRLSRHFGSDEGAFDFLTLHVLAESSFAVSCARSSTYTVIASAGFIETFAMVTGLGPERATDYVRDLALRFYRTVHPDDTVNKCLASQKDAKERIIAAAASIIEREGFAAVTNRSVAAEADVSLASTTYHFDSIAEIAITGFRRVFETVNARVAESSSGRAFAEILRERIQNRSSASGGEYARSRGMVEISLASAREVLPWEMGLDMRKQRGLITYTAAVSSGATSVTRLKAASHALWSSAVSLIAVSLPEAEALFDFEAQSELASSALLGLH